MALIYPDTYELGMANQALAILYDVLSRVSGRSRPVARGVAAERAFLPWMDMAAAMRAAGVPLFSLESCTPVRAFDLLGITLPYELTYTNVLEALDLAGIPLRVRRPRERDPARRSAAARARYNPEPVADFFDAILDRRGRGRRVEIVEAHREAKRAGRRRAGTLERSRRPGRLRAVALRARERRPAPATPHEGSRGAGGRGEARALRRWARIASPTCPVVPFMDVVHDRANVEILRGCTRGCRFCQAGMVYRPVRERTGGRDRARRARAR